MPLNQIEYVDYPELKIDKHESTQMPFRYIKDENGSPVMPKVSIGTFETAFPKQSLQGMLDLIKKDSEKGFGDLF